MKNKSRRNFNKLIGTGLTVVPLAHLVASLPARADDVPMVDPESAVAVGLKYQEVSETDGLNCANCALYQADEGAEAGVCPLFSGSLVGAEAWCSAWAAKA